MAAVNYDGTSAASDHINEMTVLIDSIKKYVHIKTKFKVTDLL